MIFGPASPDLPPGAKNAVKTCLSINPGEKVALVADEPSRAVAASLAAAIENLHAPCTSLLLEDFAPRPIKSAPAPVLDRKSTRLNSSHLGISYAVFCLKKKKENTPVQVPCVDRKNTLRHRAD